MVVIRLPELLLFAEDLWRKALDRIGPAADKHQSSSTAPDTNTTNANSIAKPRHRNNFKTPSMDNSRQTSNQPVESTAASSLPGQNSPTAGMTASTATTITTTTTTAPSSTSGPGAVPPHLAASESKKRFWRHKTVHFTVFLAVFSTILSLLWIYTLTDELRRKAFDGIMNKDDVFSGIAMDNPDLVNYIRNIHLKPTTRQEPVNVTQSPEEEFVDSHLQGKRNGVYVEYINRLGAVSTTGWLESNLSWRGVIVFTDPRSYFDACRSSRDPKTRVLLACLSSDKVTKEITYHQEEEVQVTKLGENPNTLSLSKESLPASRLKCFPLYSILLAYNSTVLDYLSLDSTELQDGLVLDTIPWDLIRVSVLSIHWGSHHSDSETTAFIEKLGSHHYKHIMSLPTGKLVFLYNRQLKV